MKKKLLAIGERFTGSGFARVMTNLLSRLSNDFEVINLASCYHGSFIRNPYMIIPQAFAWDRRLICQIPFVLQHTKPDVILLCPGIQLYSANKSSINAYRILHPHVIVILYCPVESALDTNIDFTSIIDADYVVFYTQFALNLFKTKISTLNITTRCKALVIPHGVDTTVFRPINETNREQNLFAARSRLFPERVDLAHAFLILNANRNTPRKRIDLTLEIFAAFLKRYHNAYLYLHMGMLDVGCDVISIAEQLGIQEHLLFTTHEEKRPVVDDEQLNLIYNACNIGINTCTGEGWGLVAFEHAATGAPQLMPNHSAFKEIWTGNGELLNLREDSMLVDIAGAVDVIENIAIDHKRQNFLSTQSLNFVKSPTFNWNVIAGSFSKLIAESDR